MPPTIAIIGSIVADILVQTPHLPHSGENLHVPRIQMMTGGKAANAAVAFARLGGEVHLIGQVGDDVFGREALETLAGDLVNTAGIAVDPNVATGTGILLVEANGQTAFMIEPGANQTLTVAEMEAALAPLLPDLDGILFNFESPEACLARAVEMAHSQHLPVFVDAGPNRPYAPTLWRQAAILTPNQVEAEAIVGFPIVDMASAEAAARQLLAHGPQIVVLKLGRQGAMFATPVQIKHIPAFPIQAIDSAGAGDAFTAGLVFSVLQGAELRTIWQRLWRCGSWPFWDNAKHAGHGRCWQYAGILVGVRWYPCRLTNGYTIKPKPSAPDQRCWRGSPYTACRR